MTFREKGYLSPELEDWPNKVRASFPTYSKLAGEMSDLCQSVIFEIGERLPRSEGRNVVVAAATIRLTEFLQGAITLIERGMVTSARTCLRSGFEIAFFLGGLVEIPGFLQMAAKENAFQSIKLFNARIAMAEKHVTDPEERASLVIKLRHDIARIRKEVDLSEGVTLKGWSLRDDVAAKCGLLSEYDTFYRLLSTDAAHAVFYALHDIFEEGTDSLQFGPGSGDYFDTFYLLMALGDVGLSQVNVLLKSKPLADRLAELHQQVLDFETKRLDK